MANRNLLLPVLTLLLLSPTQVRSDEPRPYTERDGAVCVLIPTEDSEAAGVIELTQYDDYTRVAGEVKKLKAGSYKLALRMYGDLRQSGMSSAETVVSIGDPRKNVTRAFEVTLETAEVGTEIDFKVTGLKVKDVLGRSFVVSESYRKHAHGVIGIASPQPVAEE